MPSKADQKVAVAYAHPTDLSSKFHVSLVRLLVLDAYGAKMPDGRKVGGRGRIGAGGAHIPVHSGAQITKSRNKIVRDFLELDGIDWLWCIDADMEFSPDLLEQLVEAAHPVERPIVGGLCFAYMRDNPRKFWPTLYAWIPGSERLRRLTQYPADSLMPVAATGAACLLVHRSVFVKMAERFPPPWPWFAETPFYERGEDGKPILETGDTYSEDITFCLRAQAAGFPIFVHTGIKLGHVKEFVADEEAFIAESERLHEACVPALPTYAVIASKSRPEMLETLRAQLEGQVTDTFVFDNGYSDEDAPALAILAHDWPLHRMWNTGLDMAEKAAGGSPFNVIVINDDVEVPNEFAAQLEAGLRAHEDHWVAYPNWQGLDVEPGRVARTRADSLAGQTMSGWAFMVRGEAGLRFDERFSFWYGDSQLEWQVKEAGKYTVCVGGCFARHLDPVRSTLEDPERLAQAEADEALFAEIHGLDPATLWLAQRRVNAGR
jgi:hypothetical protein